MVAQSFREIAEVAFTAQAIALNDAQFNREQLSQKSLLNEREIGKANYLPKTPALVGETVPMSRRFLPSRSAGDR